MAAETASGIPLPRLLFDKEANDFFTDITAIYELVMKNDVQFGSLFQAGSDFDNACSGCMVMKVCSMHTSFFPEAFLVYNAGSHPLSFYEMREEYKRLFLSMRDVCFEVLSGAVERVAFLNVDAGFLLSAERLGHWLEWYYVNRLFGNAHARTDKDSALLDAQLMKEIFDTAEPYFRFLPAIA
jgi:hypothetical protein